jgi:hypothetical protein
MTTPKSLQCDAKEIQRSLQLIIEPHTLFEIRLLKCHKGEYGRPFTAAGYFDDVKTAVEAVVEWDRLYRPEGSYVTLNPVDQRLLERVGLAVLTLVAQQHQRARSTSFSIVGLRWAAASSTFAMNAF